MMRLGVLSLGEGYAVMRAWHVALQMHFFLGVCMVGFLLQASPRLLDSRESVPRGAIAILSLFLSALLLLGIDGGGQAWRVFLSVAYLGTAFVVTRVARGASDERRWRIAAPLVLGLVGFVVAAWVDGATPNNGLLLFWLGPAPILAATAQQFLVAVLGLPAMSMRSARVLLACYLATSVSLGWAMLPSSSAPLLWKLAAVLGSATVIGYIAANSVAHAWRRCRDEPLSLVFTLSSVWLAVAALCLFAGPRASDAILHLFSTGIAVPLLLVLTSRIMNFFSEREVLSERAVTRLLLLWQVVPMGRGLGGMLPLPALVSWLVVVVAAVVVLCWVCAITFGIVRSLNVRWRLGDGAPAARC